MDDDPKEPQHDETGFNTLKKKISDERGLDTFQYKDKFLKKDFAYINKLWVSQTKLDHKLIAGNTLSDSLKKEDSGMVVHYYHVARLFRHISSRIRSSSCYRCLRTG